MVNSPRWDILMRNSSCVLGRAGACCSPGYIQGDLQGKGTSGSLKFLTILCWSIVGGKGSVFFCVSETAEKSV